MNWMTALEILVARTGHERYRVLCADDNPDVDTRDAYRVLMIRLASDLPEPPEPPEPAEPADTDADAALRAHLERHGPCCP
jgi:hypothetical protein